MNHNKCKICKDNTLKLFSASVLGKHNVCYYKCPACEFIQTEDPYWLDEAYSSAISELDVGLVSRNLKFSELLDPFLEKQWGKTALYLDHGGGYGLFVRMMRDRGFNFYRQDIYCQNLFASGFDITDIRDNKNFSLITAFEVFEHLVEPIDEISAMFEEADSILFSTHLQPDKEIRSADDWWYFIPVTGQHISFYSERTISYIAEKFNKTLYTNKSNLHLLCDPEISIDKFNLSMPASNRDSLLQSDAEKITHAYQLRHSANIPAVAERSSIFS